MLLAPRNICIYIFFLFGLDNNHVPTNLSENSEVGPNALSMLPSGSVSANSHTSFLIFFTFNKAAVHSILLLELSGFRY